MLQKLFGNQVNEKEARTVERDSVTESVVSAEGTEDKSNLSPHIVRIHNGRINVRIFMEPTTRPVHELQKEVKFIQDGGHSDEISM